MADPRWKLPDGFDDDVRKALRNLLFALRNAYKSIPSTAWEQLRLGNIQAFMDLIDWSSFKGDLSEFQDILRDAAKRAGNEVLTDGDIVLDYAFDLVDARAVDFAYNRSSQLITVITEEAKANIRQIIGDATNGQMTYFQAGQRIRSHIGLTERDAGAVDKFRNRTFERLMRDGLSEAKAREKAEEKAAKYADKLLRRRAETISRTELADAASTGRFNGWQTGVEQGLIDNASVKEWLAEPNACPICSGFAGKKIPWNAQFAEGIKMSPAHPNCRCRVVILPPDYAEEVYTTKKAVGWGSVMKHLAGKHDQSTHAGGSASRPYELQENKSRKKNWEWSGEHTGKFTMYNNYDRERYDTYGPTNELLITATSRIASDARTGAALDLAAGEKGLNGITDVHNEILNDPDYPKVSDEELWDVMKDVNWVKDRGLTSMDDIRATTSIGESYSRTFAQWKADGRGADVEAYLKKENAFVVDKLENRLLPSGQRIGDVLDSIAKDSLSELGQMSIDEDVSLFMPAGRLKKMIADGRFKTVYETTRNNKGGTRSVYMDARESSEYQMGVPEYTKDADRPVYGIIGSGNLSSQYGNTKVIFKDAIKHRTTVTVGDSIDGGPRAYWMSDLAEKNYTPADFWQKTGGNVFFSTQNSYSPVFDRGTVANGRDSYVKGYQKTTVRNLAWGGNGYIESQIHGGVKLSDVAKIVLPKPTALPAATRNMLQEQGIEIEYDSSLKSDD